MNKLYRSVTLLLVVCVLLAAAVASAHAAMPYATKNVTVIFLGPKNPTFNESLYPDLKFYYTPQLKWGVKTSTGTPEFLVGWLNKKLEPDTVFITDKDGIVAFVTFLYKEKSICDAQILGDVDNVGSILKSVVEEKHSVYDRSSKPADYNLITGLRGHKFPSFNITTASGETVSTETILYSDYEPKMLMFSYIPEDHVFKSAEDTMKNTTTFLQAISGIANMTAGDEYTLLFDKLETEIYCNSVNH